MKVLVAGRADGEVLKTDMPINFLGTVDKTTGTVSDGDHELAGRSVAGSILAFPSGVGSSVGAYTIHSISSNGAAPLAMICTRADLTVATGCAVAGIPLVVVPEGYFASLRTGERVAIDTSSGGIITRSAFS